MNKGVDPKKFAEKVAKYFAKHTDRDKVYATADGQVFFLENDALGHSSNMKHANEKADTTVLPINRADVAELIKAADTAANIIAAVDVEEQTTETTESETAPATEPATEPKAEPKAAKSTKKA